MISDIIESNSQAIKPLSPIPQVTPEVHENIKRALEDIPEITMTIADPPTDEISQKRSRISVEEMDDSKALMERLLETKAADSDVKQSHEEGLHIADEDSNISIRLESDTEEAVQVELERIVFKQPPIRLLKRGTPLRKQGKMQKKTSEIKEKVSVAPKKRISLLKTRRQMARKRLKPCTRANQELIAAWVQKYNIEECWIRLDLCDPNMGTEGKNVV